jgi:protein phosphatase
MMRVFDHASRTTKGARDYQEDMALVWPGSSEAPAGASSGVGEGQLIAVLADGMGGHAGGALASRIVCERFLEACARHVGEVQERLLAGLMAANDAVADKVRGAPWLSGMGSTMIGVVLGSEGVNWVSVGDSPLLLVRRGEIAHLNEDHSLAPELDRLAASGHISAEEARRDPRRHMLRSALTGDELDLVDVSVKPLAIETGDTLILASDGLHTLDDEEIARIVAGYAADGAAAVASALIRAVEAIRDPHQDNATVVVVRRIPAVAPTEAPVRVEEPTAGGGARG